MSSIPCAVSRIGEQDSCESQNDRAIRWLLDQPGGSVVVVTPRRQFSGPSLNTLIKRPGVTHLTWREFHGGPLAKRRILCAWPDRKRLNELWALSADALAVIEWNESETAEWLADTNPIQLLPDHDISPEVRLKGQEKIEPLPNGVDGILEHVAGMAAGYSSGLKWNEEDKLKADMMNRPDRWIPVSVDQLRAKCRDLGMRPNDVDTISGFLQRRKEGRRFNVQSSYRSFRFN